MFGCVIEKITFNNVTAHFTWEELACHNGDQIPNDLRTNAKKLCENLEVIRESFGGKALLSFSKL